jgi:hypothetical protein
LSVGRLASARSSALFPPVRPDVIGAAAAFHASEATARTVDSTFAPKTRRTFAGLPFLSPCRGKERPRIAVYWFPTASTMRGMAGPFSFARAERRLGELIRAQKETVGLNQGAAPGKSGSKGEPVLDARPTLAAARIDKKLSSRVQKKPGHCRPGLHIDARCAGVRCTMRIG